MGISAYLRPHVRPTESPPDLIVYTARDHSLLLHLTVSPEDGPEIYVTVDIRPPSDGLGRLEVWHGQAPPQPADTGGPQEDRR
jgi:hypothetical protein